MIKWLDELVDGGKCVSDWGSVSDKTRLSGARIISYEVWGMRQI